MELLKNVVALFLLLAAQDTVRTRPNAVACAAANDIACIRDLLAKGADIEARDHNGLTALMAASKAGAIGAVKELVARGADLEAVDRSYNMNALTYAIWQQKEEVILTLLAAGAKVEPTSGIDSPLFRAAVSGPHRFVALLLDAGASVESRTRFGETPLFIASCNASTDEKLRLLIAAGSDVNAVTRDGRTPLLCAVEHSRRNAVRLLLGAHADPNAIDNEGNCAWSLALEQQAKFQNTPLGILDLLRGAGTMPCLRQ